MSTKNEIGNEGLVEEQTVEQVDERAVDEESFEVVDESPEFRATVEMEIQAKVDLNHPDGVVDTKDERISGVTLEEEECIRAREAELAYISAKAKLGTQEGRAERTRRAVRESSIERRKEFQKRAASVDPLVDPERPNPREELSREELAAVNKQAMRLDGRLDGWSRAAISRRLAERMVCGAEMMGAVVGVYDELRTAPGQVILIADVGEVNRKEVSIEGRVVQLWTPSHPRISQVGLIEDDSATIKFTAWRASEVPIVREGERVTFRSVAKNWYEGRCSVALTGWSDVLFPERGQDWK